MKLRVKINDNLQGEPPRVFYSLVREQSGRGRGKLLERQVRKVQRRSRPGGVELKIMGDLKLDTTTESRQKFGETEAPQTRRIENLPPSRPLFCRSVAVLTTLLRSEARVESGSPVRAGSGGGVAACWRSVLTST